VFTPERHQWACAYCSKSCIWKAPSFSFRPARREGVPLLTIGLAGAASDGAAMSFSFSAKRESPPRHRIRDRRQDRVHRSDTENRRGLHYADRFDFMHAELAPPFTPARYGEAIKAAEDARRVGRRRRQLQP
jgi:hypothetical protein